MRILKQVTIIFSFSKLFHRSYHSKAQSDCIPITSKPIYLVYYNYFFYNIQIRVTSLQDHIIYTARLSFTNLFITKQLQTDHPLKMHPSQNFSSRHKNLSSTGIRMTECNHDGTTSWQFINSTKTSLLPRLPIVLSRTPRRASKHLDRLTGILVCHCSDPISWDFRGHSHDFHQNFHEDERQRCSWCRWRRDY